MVFDGGTAQDRDALWCPLWGLHALAGGRHDDVVVGREELRGVATTRLRLSVAPDRAARDSEVALGFPPRPVAAFPAEVWLDDDGRFRRIACDWVDVTRRVRRLIRGRGSWIVTDFWDFGVELTIPEISDAVDGS